MATSRGTTDANSPTIINSTAPPGTKDLTVIGENPLGRQATLSTGVEGQHVPTEDDAFGNEEGAEIQHKTCKLW